MRVLALLGVGVRIKQVHYCVKRPWKSLLFLLLVVVSSLSPQSLVQGADGFYSVR